MITLLAPVTFQRNKEVRPSSIVSGKVLKRAITGGLFTLTVIVLLVLWLPLLAVRVYVVVLVGNITLLPDKATAPIPWSMVTEFAPVTVHCNVVEAPAVIVDGSA